MPNRKPAGATRRSSAMVARLCWLARIACQITVPNANRQKATTGPGAPTFFTSVEPSDSPRMAASVAATPLRRVS